MKHRITANTISFFTLTLAAIGLLRFPKEVSQAIRESLNMCFDTLLPSLYPFFVLSSLTIKSGVSLPLGRLFSPIMGPLFHLPGRCVTPFLIGLLGGYPTGAKAVVSMYREGQCSKSEAQRLLSFCVNCGPAFTIGAVGCGLFGSTKYGFLLAGTHLLSAVSVGIILNHSDYREGSSCVRPAKNAARPFISSFVLSVTESMHAFIDLCAFILCFSAVTELIILSGFVNKTSHLLNMILDIHSTSALITGFFEMTRGIMALSLDHPKESLLSAAGLLAWGGLSVHFQVLSLLQETDLSPATYLKGKVLQTSLSIIWMWVILENKHGLLLMLFCLMLCVPKKAVEIPGKILYNGHRKTREL